MVRVSVGPRGYDYEGLRLQRTATKPGTPNNTVSTYTYAYLQNNQPAFKYNVSENTFDVFVYEGANRIARFRIDNTSNVSKEYFVNNYQGSPIAVVKDDQSISFQNYFDPFGNMEMCVGIPSSNPQFAYTGKELDEDSGLFYFQARYMDPITGRFIGRDNVKIENRDTEYFQLNNYQFCRNNPIRYTDPDGDFAPVIYIAAVGVTAYLSSLAMDPTTPLDANQTITDIKAAASNPTKANLASAGVDVAAFALPVISVAGIKTAKNALESSSALKKAYRYIGEAEKQIIEKKGFIPNTDRLNKAKDVFISPNKYKSAAEAEKALQIGKFNPTGATETPKYRAEVDATKTKFSYAGNVQGGTGSELITNQQVPVLALIT